MHMGRRDGPSSRPCVAGPDTVGQCVARWPLRQQILQLVLNVEISATLRSR